jgi:hypothetical protein
MRAARLRQALLGRISAPGLLSLAQELRALDRTPGSSGLDACAASLAGRLRAAGGDVTIASVECGADSRYFGWRLERRPFTERAELWLIEPAGRELPICSSPGQQGALMGAYRATEPEGEVFELVDVGLGTRASDFRSHRMAGKVALASGHQFQAAMVEALAVRNAEGLLCGPGGQPGRVRNRLGDPSLFGRHRPFGFNLERAQYDALAHRLAAEEELRVRVRIAQALGSSALPVVRARVPGSDLVEEQVLLIADAADADGGAAACLVEIARSLRSAVVDGALPPPRRSVELLAVPSLAGAVAWRALGGAEARAALVLGVDGIEAPAFELRAAALPARPSFLPDLLLDHLAADNQEPDLVERAPALRARRARYCQCWPLAPFADLAAPPAAWLGAEGVRGEGREAGAAARALCAALGAAIYDLASVGDEDLPRLVASSGCKGLARLAAGADALRKRAGRAVEDGERAPGAGRHLLWQVQLGLGALGQRERATLASCAAFVDGGGRHALTLAEAGSSLEQLGAALERALHGEVVAAVGPRARLAVRRRPLSALERRAQMTIVHRLGEGPPPVLALLRDAAPADRDWLAHNAGALAGQPVGEILLGLADGKRTLLEIVDLLELDYPEVDLRLVGRYLEAAQGAGMVRLEETPRLSSPDDGGEEGEP